MKKLERQAKEGASRQSLGQHIYKLLREQILSLELAPSTELDEVQISRDFGFSRTPVREALIRLAGDGLVILAPNRGARVAPIDIDQIPQTLEALELLERITARWAAQRRKPEDLQRLEDCNRHFMEACKKGDQREIVEANLFFHDAINQACGNRYMGASCSKILHDIMRLSLLAFRQEKNPSIPSNQEVARQHDDLISAIRDQDEDRAEKLIFQHSDAFRERIKAFIMGSTTAAFNLS